MKKLFIFTLLFLGITIFCQGVEAYDTDYSTYVDIQMAEGKLISEWTDEEYAKNLKQTAKRKMFGWRIYYANKGVETKYTSDVLLSIYNDGSSPIKQKYSKDLSSSSKRVTVVKGGIKLTGKASNKKLSGGLEADIDASLTTTDEYSTDEKWDFDMQIDPQTKLVIYIEGTARVTNGTATKYSAFIRCLKGGFEIFLITSQYLRIEKTRVR